METTNNRYNMGEIQMIDNYICKTSVSNETTRIPVLESYIVTIFCKEIQKNITVIEVRDSFIKLWNDMGSVEHWVTSEIKDMVEKCKLCKGQKNEN